MADELSARGQGEACLVHEVVAESCTQSALFGQTKGVCVGGDEPELQQRGKHSRGFGSARTDCPTPQHTTPRILLDVDLHEVVGYEVVVLDLVLKLYAAHETVHVRPVREHGERLGQTQTE